MSSQASHVLGLAGELRAGVGQVEPIDPTVLPVGATFDPSGRADAVTVTAAAVGAGPPYPPAAIRPGDLKRRRGERMTARPTTFCSAGRCPARAGQSHGSHKGLRPKTLRFGVQKDNNPKYLTHKALQPRCGGPAGKGWPGKTIFLYSVVLYRPGLIGHCIQCIHRATRTLRSDEVTVTNVLIIPGGPRPCLCAGGGPLRPPSRADRPRQDRSAHRANGSSGKAGS